MFEMAAGLCTTEETSTADCADYADQNAKKGVMDRVHP